MVIDIIYNNYLVDTMNYLQAKDDIKNGYYKLIGLTGGLYYYEPLKGKRGILVVHDRLKLAKITNTDDILELSGDNEVFVKREFKLVYKAQL